jgi:uncharacterized protein
MKLQVAQSEGSNIVTGYGEAYVDVKGIRYETNIVILRNRLIEDWTAASFASLALKDFQILADLDVEIVLVGTGTTFQFPNPELLQPFMRAHRGFEVMDNHAACRTYNVLLSEGRNAAAALVFH